MGEPPEVIGRLVRLYADHRQAEAAPDDAGDVAKRDALVGDRRDSEFRGVPFSSASRYRRAASSR